MEEKRVIVYGNELYHYAIFGQKWGKRRFENYDGTLTEEGKRRYYKAYNKFKKFALKNDKGFREQVKEKNDLDKTIDRKRQKAINRIDKKLTGSDWDGDTLTNEDIGRLSNEIIDSYLKGESEKVDIEKIQKKLDRAFNKSNSNNQNADSKWKEKLGNISNKIADILVKANNGDSAEDLQKLVDQAIRILDSDDYERALKEAEEKFEKKLSKSSLGDRKYRTDSALMRRAEEKVRGFLGEDYNLINSETSKKLGEEYVSMLLSDAKNYNPLAAIFW